ncbi:MAG: hypothetical protein KatS3mg108_3783 [Isosphaeraceae bacterium]|jgi:hypothetical protein|nr:MAG: hypothetical protein KatS3mg108_3783 [Isosphaeraceae bacterium]
MTAPLSHDHPLHRLFRGLTEHTFLAELGIGDPSLVGYVSDLLVRFVPSGNVWRVRDRQGRVLTEVVTMLAEAEASEDDDRRRDCYRHVGDFTLFWTGVFPESLGAGQTSARLVEYQRQGKRSYLLASTFEGEAAPVLRRLSVEFELCAFGLSRVRKEWERLEPPPGTSARLIA